MKTITSIAGRANVVLNLVQLWDIYPNLVPVVGSGLRNMKLYNNYNFANTLPFDTNHSTALQIVTERIVDWTDTKFKTANGRAVLSRFGVWYSGIGLEPSLREKLCRVAF